jgi:hypothetical protein
MTILPLLSAVGLGSLLPRWHQHVAGAAFTDMTSPRLAYTQALKGTRGSRKSDEHKLQCQIVDLLEQARAKDVHFWSSANGLFSNPITVRRAKAAGLRPGVADLSIVVPGSGLHQLEVKIKGGSQSADQRQHQINCIATGTPYHIVYDFDQAKAVLTDIGALRSAAA